MFARKMGKRKAETNSNIAPSVLLYHPSKKNSFGHAAVPRSLIDLRAKIYNFMENWTVGTIRNTARIEVTGPSHDENVDDYDKYFALVQRQFGDPKSSRKGYVKQSFWNLEPGAIDNGFDFIIKTPIQSEQRIPPIQFIFTYDFLWFDQEQSRLFPNQEYGHNTSNGASRSTITFIIDKSAFVQPSLIFPSNTSDLGTRGLLESVLPQLPFNPSALHFRNGLPRKGGQGYYPRKLSSSELGMLGEILKKR